GRGQGTPFALATPARVLSEYAELGGDGAGEALGLRGTQRPAMVRRRAGTRWRALDNVQPIQRTLSRRHPPLIGERTRVSQVTGAVCKKIRIEREDHLGFLEIINGVDVFTECQTRPRPGAVRARGFVLVPLGGREHGEQ